MFKGSCPQFLSTGLRCGVGKSDRKDWRNPVPWIIAKADDIQLEHPGNADVDTAKRGTKRRTRGADVNEATEDESTRVLLPTA